jgi:alpha-D-ribose 1-methylphosphonate 5-triphosphate synthase subunit PhnH
MGIEAAFTAEALQVVFRQLLEATARPGRVYRLSGAEADLPAHFQVLSCLVDGSASLSDSGQHLSPRQWSLLQARAAESEQAQFILADGSQPPRFSPSLGTLESPEYGATLIVTVDVIGDGPMELACQGPGIDGQQGLRLSGLTWAWLSARRDWNASFPLGVDIYLADACRVCALPRTTTVTFQS